jgi:chromosome segregation ATPase
MEPSLDLSGRAAEPAAKAPPRPKSFLPEGVKTAVGLALVVATAYLLYDNYSSHQKTSVELASISDQIKALENRDKVGEARLTSLRGELSQTQQSVGTTRQELLRKTSDQIVAETHRAKQELNQAIATKADSAQVQALKQEADSKFGQVSTEVGGVKTEVGTVKTDLASTRRDLEGTQRQLLDVNQTLTAAVAKNSGELAELRRKGERDFYEFEIPKKNQMVKVEDIRLLLTNTDAKRGKYSMAVLVDDNKLEKKDRTVNEPVQFLVGRNRLRYEVVVNWVQKDKVGGYLSIPKDKALGAEKSAAAK